MSAAGLWLPAQLCASHAPPHRPLRSTAARLILLSSSTSCSSSSWPRRALSTSGQRIAPVHYAYHKTCAHRRPTVRRSGHSARSVISHSFTTRSSPLHQSLQQHEQSLRHNVPPPPLASNSSSKSSNIAEEASTAPSIPERHLSITELMRLPDLDPLTAFSSDAPHPPRTPRDPIVLCHGLYGFDVRGPFFGLEIHYWAKVIDILRKKIGVEVILKGVPGTGSIKERAEALHEFLCSPAAGVRGKKLHFIGHSMGGLDARYLISKIRPTPDQYTPLTLTTLSTPHRGSPFMDWCNANVGIGNEFIEMEIERAKMEGMIPAPKKAGMMEETPAEERSEGLQFARDIVGNDAQSKSTFVKAATERSTTAQGVETANSKPRPPFSLKEPLFIRRKEAKKASDEPGEENEDKKPGMRERLQEAARAAEAAEARAESDSAKKEEKKKDSSKSSGPLDLGGFTRMLSSISGSFSNYMLSALDQPAYAMLSTRYMSEVFNPTVPDHPDVKYFSVAARVRKLPIWHPLWLPQLVLDAAAESRTAGGEVDGSADALGGDLQGNDGLVSVESAKWGDFKGIVEGCDHWDLRGGGAPRLASKINPITGRPYVTRHEEGQEGEKKDGSSWMDINRILRALTRSKGKETKKNTSDSAGVTAATSTDSTGSSNKSPSTPTNAETPSSASSKPEDTKPTALAGVTNFLEHYAEELAPAGGRHLLTRTESETSSPFPSISVDSSSILEEVAGWISERLPQGDEERRKEADRKAQEYEDALSSLRDQLQQPTDVASPASAGAAHATMAGFLPDSDLQQGSPTAGTVKSPASGDQQITSAFIQPDAAPKASIADARDQRGERPPQAADTKVEKEGQTKAKKEEKKKEERKMSKADEQLERFWLAVCYHLSLHGY